MENMIIASKPFRKNELVYAQIAIIDQTDRFVVTEWNQVVGIKDEDSVVVFKLDPKTSELTSIERYSIVNRNHDTGVYDCSNIKPGELHAMDVVYLYPNNDEIIPSNKICSLCAVELQKAKNHGVNVDESESHEAIERKIATQKTYKKIRRFVSFLGI